MDHFLHYESLCDKQIDVLRVFIVSVLSMLVKSPLFVRKSPRISPTGAYVRREPVEKRTPSLVIEA